jgi:type IV pilus assembly protein PilM
MFLSMKKEIIGIDIGSSSVKLVQIKEHNTLMDTSSIVETIKKLLKSLNIRVKDAACSVSGNSVIIRKISLPAMPPEELEDQIHWEAEQYIPFDINDVHIDFQILASDQNDPSKMEVLLVASKKEIINDYLAVFNEAGINLAVVDVDSFAMQNAFELNYDIGPDNVVALINIGASIMNLNIVKNDISLFTRDVQMGGNLYTEEIQKQFGVSSEEAERMKVSGDASDQAKLRDTISRVNETLAMEMRRSLDFYNTTAGEGKINNVYISGGGAKTLMLVEAVQQRLGLPVEIINPFCNVKYNEKEFDPEYLNEIGPLVTVAVGLATRRFGDK